MTNWTGTLLGFLCIGLSLLGCPKNVPVKPLPPAVDGSVCATVVVVKSEDVCVDYFTPTGLACIKCRGGSNCVAKDIVIWCVDEKLGCADPLCSKVTAPPSHR